MDVGLPPVLQSSSPPDRFVTVCQPRQPAEQDGVLDAWDVLYQQKAPILSTKVSDEALNCLKVHEQGCLVAVGCNNGNTVNIIYHYTVL